MVAQQDAESEPSVGAYSTLEEKVIRYDIYPFLNTLAHAILQPRYCT